MILFNAFREGVEKVNQSLRTLLICATPFGTLGAAAAQAPEMIRPEQVLSVVTADWNSDGSMDRALLVQNEDDADLFIYFSTGPGASMRLAAYQKGFAWTGILFGTLPQLALTSNPAAFQVVSENDAIGRDRWKQTLTLVFRNNAFVVAGYTLNSRDTLDPNNVSACDVNLLTGKGVANGKPFTSKTKAMPLAQWTSDTAPQGCPQ